LRGGRSVRVSRSNASFRHWQATFVAPEGRRVVATGGANPEGERNPWKWPQEHWPPRRGGGNARRARRIGGARRAGRLLRPSGAVLNWRNLPRVALALLAPPVATNLRPSGAADPCASAVQTRPFVTGKRPSSPRRGAGLLPRVERSRRRSATRGKSRELMSRPGGAAETCGVQCALP